MTRLSSFPRSLALLPLLAAPARTQSIPIREAPDPGRVLLETDPATFALNGYSAHARIELGGDSKWVAGAGVYALDFPKAMVDLDSSNRGQGWDVRLKFGAGMFLDRFFSRRRDGWFLGVQAASQQVRLRNSRSGPGEVQYTSLLLMPRTGYLWKPGSSGFYLMPWVGVGYADKLSGETRLAGAEYHVSKVLAFATVHMGWQF